MGTDSSKAVKAGIGYTIGNYLIKGLTFLTIKLSGNSEKILAGGKGINVSIVLKNLGIESIALGFIAIISCTNELANPEQDNDNSIELPDSEPATDGLVSKEFTAFKRGFGL